MDVQACRRLFQPTVRVRLDWDALARVRPPISLTVTDTDAIGGWVTPWYVDDSGSEVGHDAPGARPIPIADLATVGAREPRATRLGSIGEMLRVAPAPLLLPAYGLDRDLALVLDGNHRLTACVMGGISLPCLTAVIEGPLDPAILPDLAHWT